MTFEYKVQGGDFTHAGYASSQVKKMLKQLDVDNVVIKRVVVCLYEAEVNIVAHAWDGVISIVLETDTIFMKLTDNGPGISGSAQDKLFQPLESTKPTGLGVGLYITKHLIESHFKGTLTYIPTASGATFQITIKATTSP